EIFTLWCVKRTAVTISSFIACDKILRPHSIKKDMLINCSTQTDFNRYWIEKIEEATEVH
ncbi:MAG: hypothetical protein AAFP20_25540, partial [Cyanobacteria bacterium J06614_10]